MLHLADAYDPRGLVIDFGTASRFKYTNGNWQSGWLDDRLEDRVSVSTFASKAQVEFPLASDGAMQLRIRLKAYASGALTLQCNGKRLAPVRLSSGKGFEEVVVELPAEVTLAGENELKLGTKATTRVDGKHRSAAVDWIRVEAAAGSGASSKAPAPKLPREENLSIDGVEHRAVRLAPGAQLDWFVELPAGAVVEFRAAGLAGKGAVLAVDVKGDRENATLAKRVQLGTEWAPQELLLGHLAGEATRLRFRNDGPEALALSDIRVERGAGEVSARGAHARNVIVLLVDTLRASKLRLYNPKSRVDSPVLDQLAADGVLFERPQAPENWTKPSVASVLTSLYPSSHHTQSDASKLSESLVLLSEVYQDAGFETASFITNSFVSPEFGFDQGWDLNVNMDYLADGNEGNAENVFEAAGDWLEKNHGERFFLYIQTIDPHAPYDPPPKYIEMYDPKPYEGQIDNKKTPALILSVNKNAVQLTDRDKERLEALHDGEITYHDTELGHFLERIKALGLDRNTIVVVTSDHGEEFGEHGKWGHGHSMYQELLHVPLVFRWPGAIPAGVRLAPVVSIIDIGPTVLEASGVAIPATFEGRSLMGFMRGDWPRGPYVAFSEWQRLNRVIRGGDWKLVLHAFYAPVLYDLRNDPSEATQLDGAQHPIAWRYLRTLGGQFMGTPDRVHWLAPTEATAGASARPAEPKEEKREMTPELCRQLVALGYVIAECE